MLLSSIQEHALLSKRTAQECDYIWQELKVDLFWELADLLRALSLAQPCCLDEGDIDDERRPKVATSVAAGRQRRMLPPKG